MTTQDAINHIMELEGECRYLKYENKNLKILLYRVYTNNFTEPLNNLEEGVALEMKYTIREGKLITL